MYEKYTVIKHKLIIICRHYLFYFFTLLFFLACRYYRLHEPQASARVSAAKWGSGERRAGEDEAQERSGVEGGFVDGKGGEVDALPPVREFHIGVSKVYALQRPPKPFLDRGVFWFAAWASHYTFQPSARLSAILTQARNSVGSMHVSSSSYDMTFDRNPYTGTQLSGLCC